MSIWNGFKLMSRPVADAIRQSDRSFPPNTSGSAGGNPREHAVVFHDLGGRRPVPGPVNVGTEDSVPVPHDIDAPSARVFVHQHPFTGRHNHDEPSMADHLIARLHPDVEHIVQIPAQEPGRPNPYITYSGSVPPRFYTLIPNPRDLPVPPPSPDAGDIPPFHSPPRGA